MSIKTNRERKTGEELYYTNSDVVDTCILAAKPFIQPQHTLLEPCAGDGAFIDGFARAFLTNFVIACDLSPKRQDIFQANTLIYDFSKYEKLFVITNPPFGRNKPK